MKLGIFTDPHYSSQELTCEVRFNSLSLGKIKEAYEYFAKENCDIIVCLGDLTDLEDSHSLEKENLEKIAAVINDCPIPTVCVMGNHDAFAFTVEELYTVLGNCRPENLVINGKNLIFLDACYLKSGRHYIPGDSDWTDTFLPDVDKLKELLDKAEGDCYIFIHQNIDLNIREDHCIYNRKEVAKIIGSSGKVKVVFQGHYHWGMESSHDDVKYITLPAMCEGEGRYFVFDI